MGLLQQACTSEEKNGAEFQNGKLLLVNSKSVRERERERERENFVLSKNEFQDSMALRYGSPLTNLPVKCDGWGEDFHAQHAHICKKGGLITQRHNEIRDLLGDLLCLAWTYTQKVPLIREHSENQKALGADLLVGGVWSSQVTASFDIGVRQ